jgi:signal transduction histidine kinase
MENDMINQVQMGEREPVILIIDDDPNNLAIMTGLLEEVNCTILAAEDGESGVKRALYAEPDLILLDIMMPGIDGYETCRQLKAQVKTRDIPVICMTALAETEHKLKGFAAGCVDYITKPFQREEVLARVGVHLRLRKLSRELEAARDLLEERVEERTARLEEVNRDLQREMAERRKTEETLRQSQKMEAIGTLAGGIAHDFNNLLTAITGFGSLLQLQLGAASPLQDYVTEILAASDRAANLTSGLLSFSRKQIIDSGPVRLNDVVRKIDKFLLRIIGEDIEFKTMLAAQELVINADSGQLEQVLMNLVANARDAMPSGGALLIKTERIEVTQSRDGFLLEPGSYAVLSVSDTGDGIDQQTQQRIFEPFFTTKELGKGTGLGLSIVYGIIEQHNGQITVHSEPGEGTSFKIYLRLTLPRAEKCTGALAAHPLVGGTETILVAEDDDHVRGFMAHTLREYGYQVIEARDGEEALRRFAQHEGTVQLLILDVVMPKMNGKEVYQKICGSGKSIPVLFSSGYTADIINRNGVLDKGLNFLSKPMTPHDLLAKVRAVFS